MTKPPSSSPPARHTPGPWRCREQKQSYSWRIEQESWIVATAYGEANARLIAAAPALLEALRELMRQVEPAYGSEGPNQEYADALLLARSAIAQAQAEGREARAVPVSRSAVPSVVYGPPPPLPKSKLDSPVSKKNDDLRNLER